MKLLVLLSDMDHGLGVLYFNISQNSLCLSESISKNARFRFRRDFWKTRLRQFRENQKKEKHPVSVYLFIHRLLQFILSQLQLLFLELRLPNLSMVCYCCFIIFYVACHIVLLWCCLKVTVSIFRNRNPCRYAGRHTIFKHEH